jgi:hypothetical protein
MATTAAPLTQDRMVRRETWRYKQFTLKANETAFKGGLCMIKQSDAKAYAGTTATNCVFIGLFAEDKTSTVDTLVNVDLIAEKNLVWFDNATLTDAVAATDFGKVCYAFDDHSVTITNTGRSVCGRVWAVDSVKGVLVEVGAPASP